MLTGAVWGQGEVQAYDSSHMATKSFKPVPTPHDAQNMPLPEAVLSSGQTLQVPAGRLCRQGTDVRYMYCVLDGEIRLVRPGRDGGTIILQRVRRGWVAEASLLSRRYGCDLEAAPGTTLLRVPAAVLRKALDESADFRRYWIQSLSVEVRRLRGACERLGLRKAEERVLHAIETEGNDGALRWAGTLKTWAAELGLTHEALYRALARLESAGVVERQGGAIVRIKRP